MSEEKKSLPFLEEGVEDEEDSFDPDESSFPLMESIMMDSKLFDIDGLSPVKPNVSINEIGEEEESSCCVSIAKIVVLIWLALQNAIHIILIRYSRVRVVSEMFFSGVAVFFTEVFKIVFCLLMVFIETRSIFGGIRLIKKQVFDQPWDTLKVCLPAMLYIIQNNLFYLAATHLDAATFMIVSRLKIFATAIFSIALLNRQLTRMHWISLAVLSAGVTLVQLQPGKSKDTKAEHGMDQIIGFAAACLGCAISGFAGVFFERILKGSAPVSIWMRNVQMSMFSIPSALACAYISDASRIHEKGFLYGFDAVVWATSFWYGVGGLSVALCIKYADNIAKNFSSSVAIILATVGSIYFFDFHPSIMFVAGATFVIASIFIYSSPSFFPARNRPSKN